MYTFKAPSDASLGDSFDEEPEKLVDVRNLYVNIYARKLMSVQWKKRVYVLRRVFLALTPTSEAQFPVAFEPFLGHYYERFLQTPNRFLEFFAYFWLNPGILCYICFPIDCSSQ